MACRSGSFSIHKTKPRRTVSRSPLLLPAAEQAIEFGPKCETINVRVGNQKIAYNIERGHWQSDGMVGLSVGSREMTKLEKTKRELEDDNGALRAKIEVLFEMLAEITAEQHIQSSTGMKFNWITNVENGVPTKMRTDFFRS